MGDVVEFRLLGTVEAVVDGRSVDTGHARQRCVLTVLLLDANRPVTLGRLMDRVWGDRPPQRGRQVAYGYLSRLRAVLAGTPGVAITRGRGGYVLTTAEEAIDLHRFRRLSAQARACGDDDRALALFDEALALWRGPAFAELDTAWLNLARDTLQAEHRAVWLDRTDAALRCGRHAELLAGLTARAARHPLDERVAGQLMLALYRSGRQADALRHYRQVRQRLADELGADPGRPLQQVHQRILTAASDMTAARARATGRPVPRQLPTAPRWFAGRNAELATLRADSTVTVIAGPGGIGKTWLALHWAHLHSDEFPDGQLFVDLNGCHQPMSPTVALRGFLDALAVPPRRIPPDRHAQAALFRSLVADRRLLIVLDDAADVAQVTPLLPGGGTSTVLVTGRRDLTDLVTRHGAHHIRLGALTDVESRQLLSARLGVGRVAAQPDAIAELLKRCAGSPLALSVVAGRAQIAPELPLAELVSTVDTSRC